MVVTTVEEKNRDCPKLQLGPPVTLRDADTPRLFARTTSSSNASRSSSVEDDFNLVTYIEKWIAKAIDRIEWIKLRKALN